MGGWKLGYGLNFQLSKYKNSTLGILEQFDYESKIDFVKYGFFGKISKQIEKVQEMASKRAARSAPLC